MKRKMMAIVLLLLMAAALPASAQETWEPTSESIVGM